MGHCCQILEFSTRKKERTIEKECCEWQRRHCDPEECGGDGPGMRVRFTDKIFDSREKAYEYLERTFGDYDQTAVRFKDGRKMTWAVACEVHC